MIHFGDRDHGRAIAAEANTLFTLITHKVISRTEDGELYGGVLYENFTGEGGSIMMSVAGFKPNWLNRDFIWVAFDYPFNQLKVNRIFIQVHSDNTHAQEFDKSFGFKELHRLEGVFPDGDMILMQMLREDCRFLNLKPKGLRSNKENQHG